ncbi:hypothetical protein LTS08_007541 [Lithohypha guttulata]|nr:hypothetical protein LTS08_007541 [Lithohypha guttulata]
MSRHASSQQSKDSQQYQLVPSESPADQARSLTQVSPGFIFNNKDQLIHSLRTHKVNTITELRRIERIFAHLDSEEVTEPITSAWAYYVNSNNLLNELRGLTRDIPFSSECLDEAKALVVADPASARSWNYCWLVLVKIEKESLILKYARALASKRSTWGDRQPTKEDAKKFISATIAEWNFAVRQLLKHWDIAPSTTGD